jgi:hypothetical protein
MILNFLFMLVAELFDVTFDHFFDFDGIYFATLRMTNLMANRKIDHISSILG